MNLEYASQGTALFCVSFRYLCLPNSKLFCIYFLFNVCLLFILNLLYLWKNE